ncbi:hypothetical protein [Mumia zhuanghuii]|uniref:Uncharacterized protein n=1 Tax=Mumia zhuanghuii TaxID=2585211 RepID=A0A5C4MC22_9ACTN|nr:hypothetical protein [Mumia zhuanghuii]TNC31284.1 hypothetical protein FHE65_31925 [Mumia zhuanghuii]
MEARPRLQEGPRLLHTLARLEHEFQFLGQGLLMRADASLVHDKCMDVERRSALTCLREELRPWWR